MRELSEDHRSAIRRSKQAWASKDAERVISVSATLRQAWGPGGAVHEFHRELKLLAAKHGLTPDPVLLVTVVRENGRLTPIAEP